MGFTQPADHPTAGKLLPYHFALTRPEMTGRYVSVALSLRSPPLDVIQHSALRSSDFPRLPLTRKPQLPVFLKPTALGYHIVVIASSGKTCSGVMYHVRVQRQDVDAGDTSRHYMSIVRAVCGSYQNTLQ